MNELILLTQLVAKLDTNQMALQASVEEIALWIRQQGSTAAADNILGPIQTLLANADSIATAVAQLTVSTGLDGWRKP